MKKLLWIAVALALGLAGCAVTGPYSTIQHIKSGVKNRDAAELEEYIDFPVLRENLKDQASAAMLKSVGAEGGVLGALAGSFAKMVSGSVIDAFVTPQGLAKVMSGELTSLINPPKPEPEQPSADGQTEHQRRSEQLFKDARYAFDSASQFSIWAKDKNGKETQFILTRYGLKWRLTNIILAAYS